MRPRHCLILTLLLLQGATVWADPLVVASPDGSNEVAFELRNGRPFYSIRRFGDELIRPSQLGFTLVSEAPLSGGFEVEKAERSLSRCDLDPALGRVQGGA